MDQYGKDISIQGVQWSATGGDIDQNGVFLAGADAGNFTVTATVETVSNHTTFAISTKSSRETGGKYDRDDQDDSKLVPPKELSWQGEVPPQKWINFYARVLTKLASDKDIKLTLKVEFSANGISEQKLDEAIALQELGLDTQQLKT